MTDGVPLIEQRKPPGVGDWREMDIQPAEALDLAECSVKELGSVRLVKTDATRAIFGTFKRQRLEFRVHPEGKATGKPYRQMIMYCTARVIAPINGRQSYEVQHALDGGIAHGATG